MMSATYSQRVQKKLHNLHFGGETDALTNVLNVTIMVRVRRKEYPKTWITSQRKITIISESWDSRDINHAINIKKDDCVCACQGRVSPFYLRFLKCTILTCIHISQKIFFIFLRFYF